MRIGRKVVSCLVAAVAAIVAVLSAQAAPKWTYDNGVLTEIVGEGAAPWRFKVNAAGNLGLSGDADVGDSDVLDFREEAMPEGVPAIKTIGLNPYFFDASSKAKAQIREVYLPATVTSVGNNAFRNCTNLEKVDFPADVQLTTLGTYAFWGCAKLERICVGQHLTAIGGSGYSRFDGCTSLKTVEPFLPDSCTEIAFNGCTALEGALVAGGDDVAVVNIGGHAFKGSRIGSVTLGANVQVGVNAFQNCSQLTGVVYRTAVDFVIPTAAFHNVPLRELDVNAYFTVSADAIARPAGSGEFRVLVPSTHQKWGEFRALATNLTPWSSLTPEQQAAYWNAFYPDDETASTTQRVPYGLTVNKNAVGLPANTWIVGKVASFTTKELQVVGEAGDFLPPAGYQPEAGEVATFYPAYGFFEDVETTFELPLVCRAPRYVESSAKDILYEIVGGKVEVFDPVTETYESKLDFEGRSYSFSPEAIGRYRLTWKMNSIGHAVVFAGPRCEIDAEWGADAEGGLYGYYPEGTAVQVWAKTKSPTALKFSSWGSSSGILANRYDNPMKVVVSQGMTLVPVFKTPWVYDASTKMIDDGYWTVRTDGWSADGLKTVKTGPWSPAFVLSPVGGELDLDKPVINGSETAYVTSCEAKSFLSPMPNIFAIRISAAYAEMKEDLEWQLGGDNTCVKDFFIAGKTKLVNYMSFLNWGNLRTIYCGGGTIDFSNPEGSAFTAGSVRVVVPNDNEEWRAFVRDTAKAKKWDACTEEEQAVFRQYHPGEKAPRYMTLKGNGVLPEKFWIDWEPLGLIIILK